MQAPTPPLWKRRLARTATPTSCAVRRSGSPTAGWAAGRARGRVGGPAGALGVAQACLDACVAFPRTRRQFGQRLADFEMIQAHLADMAADVEAARLLGYRAARRG